jgi:hypothetical protein
MKKLHALTYLMTVVIIAWSCAPSFKVNSDYDKSADFTAYKKFALYNPDNLNKAISELTRSRVFAAIKNEMTKKGFVEDSASPDLLVNVVGIFEDRQSVSSTTTGGGMYGGYYGGMYGAYGWGGGTSHTNVDVRHYKDGSLIIDVVEASSKKLLWQGTGNKEIDGPVKNPDVTIPKAVGLIMASFPPGTSKKK